MDGKNGELAALRDRMKAEGPAAAVADQREAEESAPHAAVEAGHDPEALERKQFVHDAIDEIVKGAPDGYVLVTLPEFGKLHALASEIEQDLAALDPEHGPRGGMYGSMSERDFDLALIDRKIEKFKRLRAEVAADLNMPLADEQSAAANDNDPRSPKQAPEQAKQERRQSPEYATAREAWAEARSTSDAAEKAYRAAAEKHYKSLDEQSWLSAGRWKHEYRRLFGIAPELTDELKTLQQKTVEARNAYKKRGAELALAKYAGADAERGVTVTKRYERLLAQKLVVRNTEERLSLQAKVLREKYPNGTPAGRVMEWMKAHPKTRIAGTVGAYALIGLATGGVGAAAVAGGARLGGVFASMAAGGAAGAGMKKLLDRFYVRGRKEAHEDVTYDTRRTLFAEDIASLEAEFEESARELATAKRRARVASVGAAAAAGMVVGGSMTSAAEAAGTDVMDAGVQSEADQDARAVRTVNPDQGDLTASRHVPAPEQSELSPEAARAELDRAGEAVWAPLHDLPETHREQLPEISSAEGHLYTVQAGNNAWNIMEGTGPDANPVGGQSEFLNGKTLAERRHALDTLFEYMEKNPEFTKSVGIESGDPNLLEPGEQLNITMMDDKMRELLGASEETTAHAPERVHGGEQGITKETTAEAPGRTTHYTENPDGTWTGREIRDEHGRPSGRVLTPEEVERDRAAAREFIQGERGNSPASEAPLSSEREPVSEGELEYIEDPKSTHAFGTNVPYEIERFVMTPHGEMAEITALGDPSVRIYSPIESLRELTPGTQFVLNPGSLDFNKALEVLPSNIGDLTLVDLFALQNAAEANNPAALARLESLGADREMLREIAREFEERGGSVPLDPMLTLDQYLNSLPKQSPEQLEQDIGDSQPEATPYGEYDPFADESATVHEASARAEGGDVSPDTLMARTTLVEEVEGTKGIMGGLFGRSPGAGTFERLQHMKMDELGKVLAMDERTQDRWLAQNGIAEEGWDKWIKWIGENETTTPVDRERTFAEYVDDVAAARAGQGVTV